MPRNVSNNYLDAVISNAKELPLTLLEITHAGLTVPVRVVNDTQDITVNGDVFSKMAFRATLPDDLSKGQPRARIVIDNIGHELTDWIESTGGGKDAQVRLMQVLRSDPNVLEIDITLGLDDVNMTQIEVSGELSFDDILNRPAVTVNYRPEIAGGLF